MYVFKGRIYDDSYVIGGGLDSPTHWRLGIGLGLGLWLELRLKSGFKLGLEYGIE
jgi:hypothetical protein